MGQRGGNELETGDRRSAVLGVGVQNSSGQRVGVHPLPSAGRTAFPSRDSCSMLLSRCIQSL